MQRRKKGRRDTIALLLVFEKEKGGKNKLGESTNYFIFKFKKLLFLP